MNGILEANTVTIDNVNIAVTHYNKNSDAVVIIAPGWCMTKDSKAFKSIASIFTNDFDVMTFDFRGHGKSSGFYTFSAKEIFDLDAIISYAESKNYKKIYLVGFSLGGAVVLINAVRHINISKVIAVSPPADFSKIENHMWRKEAWFETCKKFELGRFLSLRMSVVPRKKVKPIDIVNRITAPTLFIAGENDPTVYPWHTKALYDKATCPKNFKLFKSGMHAEDMYLYFKDEFSQLCLDWLRD